MRKEFKALYELSDDKVTGRLLLICRIYGDLEHLDDTPEMGLDFYAEVLRSHDYKVLSIEYATLEEIGTEIVLSQFGLEE